ncbi:hypothetical protein MASR2M8_05660 [Opitutaceae bacterium]
MGAGVILPLIDVHSSRLDFACLAGGTLGHEPVGEFLGELQGDASGHYALGKGAAGEETPRCENPGVSI